MAAKKEAIKVGSPAPDFTLKDHNGADFRLSESKGRRVILSFHPLAWTGVCAGQMQALERNVGVMNAVGYVVYVISIQTAYVPAVCVIVHQILVIKRDGNAGCWIMVAGGRSIAGVAAAERCVKMGPANTLLVT